MQRVVIVAFEGVQPLDVTGPASVFAGANALLHHTAPPESGDGYDVTIVSPDGGVVSTESAVRLDTASFESVTGRIDTLVVAGGLAVQRHRDDQRFVSALCALIERTERLVTVCSGALLAAATGALDGHRITTHWARANRLAETHPAITVDADPIFIHSPGRRADRHADPDRDRRRSADDGGRGVPHQDVWSSAGVTAGIDLCLALVEVDHSTDTAQEVGRWLVMYLRRPGGQSQFAAPTWIRQAPVGPIQRAQDLVISEPGRDHRVAVLARRVDMSERHFVRRFTDEVGIPPAKFVARIRIDAARHELERSDDTIAAIARRCGFGTAETLRRSLHRHLGVGPESYRRRFSHRPPPAQRPASSHGPAPSAALASSDITTESDHT